jgi:hypothetical protein
MATALDGLGTWEQHDIPDPLDATTPLATDEWVFVSDIKPGGGGDFTNLKDWEAVADGIAAGATITDKTSPTPIVRAVPNPGCPFWARCYSGGNLVSTGNVTLGGFVCNPTTTQFVRIFASPEDWTDGLISNWTTPTQGAWLRTTNGTAILNQIENYVRVEGLRFICDGTSSAAAGVIVNFALGSDGNSMFVCCNTFQLGNSTSGTHVSGIQYQADTSSGSSFTRSYTGFARNNVMYGSGTGTHTMGIVLKIGTTLAGPDITLVSYVDSNTLVNMGASDGSSAQSNFYNILVDGDGDAAIEINRRDNVVLAPANNRPIWDRPFGTGSGTMTVTYTEDDYNVIMGTATYYGGHTQGANSVAVTQGQQATVVTDWTADANLVSGGPAVGVGKDLSALFTNDAILSTRTVPWDIGALKAITGGMIPHYFHTQVL